MNLLLDNTIKVSVVIVAAFAFTALLRGRSAAARHWVLSVAIAFAAAMPVLALVLPAWRLPLNVSASNRPDQQRANVAFAIVEPRSPAAHSPGMTPPRRPTAGPLSLARVIGIAWIAGVALNLGILLVGVARLAWFAARARVVRGRWAELAKDIAHSHGLRRRVLLLQTDHPSMLVTWGAARPKVMLAAGADRWPDDRVRIVLGHELAHIRRGDWVVQIAAELLKSMYWFNPLLWIACRRLRQESEHACDDAVLNLGIEGSRYATHLMELARSFNEHRRTWLPAPAIAHPSSLERRIAAMLNARLDHRPVGRSVRTAAVIAFVSITLPIAGFGGQTFGTLSGTIADPSGAVIPDATLTMSQIDNKAKHELHSDANGNFRFVGLPSGDYVLEATYIGFAPLREAVAIAQEQNVHRNLTLQVGSIVETINIAGGSDARPDVQVSPAPQTPFESRPCSPIAVGGNIRAPRKIRDVKPEYPQMPGGARADGSVVLAARIGTDGFVKELRTVSAASPEMERAASTAVSQWQFTPTFLNCEPIEVGMTVTANFRSQP